jgi:hypothetical protein
MCKEIWHAFAVAMQIAFAVFSLNSNDQCNITFILPISIGSAIAYFAAQQAMDIDSVSTKTAAYFLFGLVAQTASVILPLSIGTCDLRIIIPLTTVSVALYACSLGSDRHLINKRFNQGYRPMVNSHMAELESLISPVSVPDARSTEPVIQTQQVQQEHTYVSVPGRYSDV